VTRRVLLVALALMLLVPVVSVGSMTPLRKVRGGDDEPSAQLWASGRGVMAVAGRMTVWGSIPPRALVTVTDRAGDAKVTIAGMPQELDDGRIRVRDARGILFVTGSDLTVQIVGNGLSFNAAGNGRARLQGSGTYRLNSGKEKRWSGVWMAVARSSSERRRERRCAECSSSVVPRR
jgi:hypothetical protein